jgi:hypothetical protein
VRVRARGSVTKPRLGGALIARRPSISFRCTNNATVTSARDIRALVCAAGQTAARKNSHRNRTTDGAPSGVGILVGILVSSARPTVPLRVTLISCLGKCRPWGAKCGRPDPSALTLLSVIQLCDGLKNECWLHCQSYVHFVSSTTFMIMTIVHCPHKVPKSVHLSLSLPMILRSVL